MRCSRKVGWCACAVAQLCPTLCNAMDCSLPGSSVHGIFQARSLDGLLFPSPGDLPDPGIEPMSPLSPVLGSRFFTTVPPGKPGGVGRNHSLLGDVSVFFVLHFGRLSNHFLSLNLSKACTGQSLLYPNTWWKNSGSTKLNDLENSEVAPSAALYFPQYKIRISTKILLNI